MVLYRSALRPFGGKTIVSIQRLRFRFELTHLARRVRYIQVSMHPVAVNVKLGNTPVNQINRLKGHVPSLARLDLSQLLLKRPLPAGKTHNGLSPIASRGAAAHTVGLQHHHAVAALRQLNGRRQT